MKNGVSEPGVKVTRRPAKRRSVKKSDAHFIDAGWTVADIVALYPQATEALAEYGLHCFSCSAGAVETLEQGCSGHGFSEDDIRNLVEDINAMISY